MLEKFRLLRKFRLIRKNKAPIKEGPIKIITTVAVSELLMQNKVNRSLSTKEASVVEEINKLKGTKFQGNPGYILQVLETGSNMARDLNTKFDLNVLHLVLDGIVRQKGIPVNIDNPKEVDEAWKRYFDTNK